MSSSPLAESAMSQSGDKAMTLGVMRRVLRRRFSGSPRWIWAGNLGLLATLALWAFCDPNLPPTLRTLGQAVSPEGWSATGWRTVGVVVVLGLATLQGGWLLSGVWLGDVEFRRLKSLAILVGLVSLWLGNVLNLDAIAWQGRRWRVLPYVAAAERIVAPLKTAWPQEDGDTAEVGPFMAYPVGRPQTLILLTPPQLADGPHVPAIERSSTGALRLELHDVGGHDWLEWHPQGRPVSHIGGLLEHRELTRVTALGENWFLVRYAGGEG
ncbi:MAG: hypothetical protein KDB14_16655 [Planctomycetales bacterium]|nr:hypothetical protein [Planctomycetales bacterium]